MLAGSVLTTSVSVRAAVTRLLAVRLPGTAAVVAGPGEIGAARLAVQATAV